MVLKSLAGKIQSENDSVFPSLNQGIIMKWKKRPGRPKSNLLDVLLDVLLHGFCAT